MIQGTVFDFKKYSIHDGPGIRTTVFLKGCPLHCVWCHNPESISPKIEIQYYPERCILCGDCCTNCPEAALEIVEQSVQRDQGKCTLCGSCVEACPAEAWQQLGRVMSLEEVMDEIQKDIQYYDQSGGGVTFSGGEPLIQFEFLAAALKACKSYDLHTAVDTTGYTAFRNLTAIAPDVNLFLYDLKFMDSMKHRRFTGVPNELILSNLKSLVNQGSRVIIRIPIIPGVNDDPENLEDTGRFLKQLGNIERVDILPYHPTAVYKYQRMGQTYSLAEIQTPSEEHMQNIRGKLKTFGLKVKIGG